MHKGIQIQYQNISFKSRIRKVTPTKETNKEYQEIEKKPDPMNLEDLSDLLTYWRMYLKS